MLGLNKKTKMLNVFNPTMCLKKNLDASWSCGLATPVEESIPIEHLGGSPRLNFEYEESENDWLCGVVPLDKSDWKGIDIRNYKEVKFTFYEEATLSCTVSFVDDKEQESQSAELRYVSGISAGEECQVALNIHDLFNEKFNPRKARLIKFIGINKPHFYVSHLYLL
jgi:hypothetical protein